MASCSRVASIFVVGLMSVGCAGAEPRETDSIEFFVPLERADGDASIAGNWILTELEDGHFSIERNGFAVSTRSDDGSDLELVVDAYAALVCALEAYVEENVEHEAQRDDASAILRRVSARFDFKATRAVMGLAVSVLRSASATPEIRRQTVTALRGAEGVVVGFADDFWRTAGNGIRLEVSAIPGATTAQLRDAATSTVRRALREAPARLSEDTIVTAYLRGHPTHVGRGAERAVAFPVELGTQTTWASVTPDELRTMIRIGELEHAVARLRRASSFDFATGTDEAWRRLADALGDLADEFGRAIAARWR